MIPGKRDSIDSGIASRTMSLGLRASSDEASPSAVKSDSREGDDQEDDFGGDDNMEVAGSDDESEYVESRRDMTAARKRPRKLRDAAQVDEGEESVGDLHNRMIVQNCNLDVLCHSLHASTGVCRHERTRSPKTNPGAKHPPSIREETTWCTLFRLSGSQISTTR